MATKARRSVAPSLPPVELVEGLELTHDLECSEAMTTYTKLTLTDLLTGTQATAGQGHHSILEVPSGPQEGRYAVANGGVWAHGPGYGYAVAVIRLDP